MAHLRTPMGLVLRSGPRTLFLVGVIITAATLVWSYQMRLIGNVHGLSTVFFVLFAYNDYAGGVCALLILAVSLLGSRHIPARQVLQWAGGRPLIIAVATALLLALGTIVIY